MTIDKKWLQEYCNRIRYCITKEQEKHILSLFQNEPEENYVWTQQDIYEQINKYLLKKEEISSEHKVMRHE